METLILAAENRDQYYGKRCVAHDGFRSAPSRTFSQINCRTFHYGVGLLPRPRKTTSSTPITKGPLPQVHSPPSPNSVLPVFDCGRTTPIPIIAKSRVSQIHTRSSCEFVDKRRTLSYSELWAGPTYSNSPPPTSVPMPNFSLPQKRTVSLSFPAPDSAVDISEVAKSAPVSPTSCADNPFHTTVSATMTLRRMLNLETADDD